MTAVNTHHHHHRAAQLPVCLQTLQQLIETQFAGACLSVDLLRIAASTTVSGPYNGRVALSLVVDAECCLDRLYGGYVSGKYTWLKRSET